EMAQTIEEEPAPAPPVAKVSKLEKVEKKVEPPPPQVPSRLMPKDEPESVQEKAPTPPTPEKKTAPPVEVHEAHGNAPGRGVTLEIASQPAGGNVLLDGKTLCTTPCKIRDLSRDPVYVLKVAHEGFVSWSSIVDLRGRDGDHLMAPLRPQPGGEVGW